MYGSPGEIVIQVMNSWLLPLAWAISSSIAGTTASAGICHRACRDASISLPRGLLSITIEPKTRIDRKMALAASLSDSPSASTVTPRTASASCSGLRSKLSVARHCPSVLPLYISAPEVAGVPCARPVWPDTAWLGSRRTLTISLPPRVSVNRSADKDQPPAASASWT